MSTDIITELEKSIISSAGTIEIKKVILYLEARYEKTKEQLVVDPTPEVRGRAQELKDILKRLKKVANGS